MKLRRKKSVPVFGATL